MEAHWRHVANTIEPSVGGGDAALCQITLTTCYFSICGMDLPALVDEHHMLVRGRPLYGGYCTHRKVDKRGSDVAQSHCCGCCCARVTSAAAEINLRTYLA